MQICTFGMKFIKKMIILARLFVLGILLTWRALTARRPLKLQNGILGMKIILKNGHSGSTDRFGNFAHQESMDGQEAA